MTDRGTGPSTPPLDATPRRDSGQARGALGTGLSVAIITLDEEADLPACLASVAWADEVVVCDSGSRDRTVEIAAASGARTFQDPWRGFAGHKSLAVERCTHPWVLVLDADERVTPGLRVEIAQTLADAGGADGYTIARRNYFLGAWIRHGGWYPDRSLRLFRRGRGRIQPRAVHEVVEVEGRVAPLREPLDHYTYRSVGEFLERMGRYARLAADEMRAAGRRPGPVDLTLRPLWTFVRMYLLQRGFLDGGHGLLLAGLYTAYTFSKYAMLWEMRHGMRNAGEPIAMDAMGREMRNAGEPIAADAMGRGMRKSEPIDGRDSAVFDRQDHGQSG